jgi:hypothetical protein
MTAAGFDWVEIGIQSGLQQQRIPGTDQGRCNLLRIGGCYEFSAVISALDQICNQLSKIGIGFVKHLSEPTAAGQGGCGGSELSCQWVEVWFFPFYFRWLLVFLGIAPA